MTYRSPTVLKQKFDRQKSVGLVHASQLVMGRYTASMYWCRIDLENLTSTHLYF